MQRRELLKQVATMGLAWPLLTAGDLLAQSDETAILATVHPELRIIAKGILGATRNQSAWSLASLAEKRAGVTAYTAKPSVDVPFEQRTVPGGKGQPDVSVSIVNRKPDRVRPAILFVHGGGFVAGSAMQSVPNLQRLCRELDCLAVSVDYRLAPETRYAGAIEDGYAALKWLYAHAGQLGVDPARIAVMGESAGGGLAALLAIAARDRGEVPLCFQCLIYPMLDDRTGTRRQVPWQVGQIIWTRESNRFGWESFLGMRPGGRSVPKEAVPARVENLAGLPPTFIGVGSIDLFVDEDVDYAQRLNAANVPTELIVVPGAFHGFDSPLFPARISKSFNAAKLDALRRGLGIAAA